jgi:DNA-binding transcriptional MerR regulator
MTGLSVDTLRAWERRYNVVKPGRSARGRLYDDGDIRRLVALRDLVANGYAIGQVAGLSEAELDALVTPRELPRIPVPELGEFIRVLFSAVQMFDSARLNEELGRLATLLSPVEFVHQVALPLMREVGNRWHSGTMQAAHEHMATESVRNLLGAMSRRNRPGDAQVRILATTPSEEFHEVGVLAGAMLAGARGLHVTCLGPNLPASEILFAAASTGARIVLLGLTTPNPLPGSLATVREVAASLPLGTELWLAGAGTSHMMPLDRPGTVFLRDFNALDQNLNRVQRGMGASA